MLFRSTGKDPDAGNDQRQEAKGTKEDEMVGWHHRLNVNEETDRAELHLRPGCEH